MKTTIRILLVLVAALLVINAWSMYRIEQLTDLVIANNNSVRLDRALNELSAVQRSIQDLRAKHEEQQWAQVFEQLNTENLQDGNLGVTVTFTLQQKASDTYTVLLYREESASAWGEASVEDLGMLTYTTTLWLDPNKNWEYKAAEKTDQVIRASKAHKLDLADQFGDGDVLLREQGSAGDQIVLVFAQYPKPLLDDLKVATIELDLRFKDGKSNTVEITEEHGKFTYKGESTNLEEIEVTVVYRDGETRTALLDSFKLPVSQGDVAEVQELIIER